MDSPQVGVELPSFEGTAIEQQALWNALSRTPGVGVTVTDTQGHLLFVNATSQALFGGYTDVDYQGKTIADFHSVEFTEERLKLLGRVVESRKPLLMRHVYLGRCIESTFWPIADRRPPFNRVIVVSRLCSGGIEFEAQAVDTSESKYIELGPLNVLTRRELEVFVMLGHGMGVPQIAKTLVRSPKTIERHKTAIARKLMLKSQSEIVRLVTMLGLEFEHAHLTRIHHQPAAKRTTRNR